MVPPKTNLFINIMYMIIFYLGLGTQSRLRYLVKYDPLFSSLTSGEPSVSSLANGASCQSKV